MTILSGLFNLACFSYFSNYLFYISSAIKFANNVSWMILYMFTPEIYDTLIRSTAFGFTNSFARVGAALGINNNYF
jgi:hypothetical protein